MTVEVKICGLKTAATMAAALDAGADYVGLVFYPRSPRNVSLDEARALAEMARGRAKSVALFVDPSDALLDDVVHAINPDMLQLHGNETRERLADIARRDGRPIIKAVKVATREDAAAALDYRDACDLILFDAKAPPVRPGVGDSAALPGGNGLAFDWQILDTVKHGLRFMLSGGLTPDTVAEAILRTGAAAVDVSSGVERAPGEKDERLIADFVRAAKAAGKVEAAETG